MESQSGIYKITNLINNKMYVGSAVNLKKRKSEHFHTLRNGSHHNYHLQRSFNKYGEENFEFSILEYMFDNSIILQREQYWIDFYRCYNAKIGYNICRTAGSHLGMKNTEASKLKNSKSHKALHLTGDKSARYGTKHSEETKYKMSLSSCGEKSPTAILKAEQVKEIRFMIMDGYKNTDIAKKYAVNSTTISSIKKGTSWKSVEFEGFTSDDLKQINNNIGVNKVESKFTEEDIIGIKIMISEGKKAKDIALIFNCNIKDISSIKRGKVYANILVDGITQDSLRNKHALFSTASRLTVDDVITIKCMLRDKILLQKEIALRFNVSNSCINGINIGKTYKNVVIPEDYVYESSVA